MRIVALALCLLIYNPVAAEKPGEVTGAERGKFFSENSWLIPRLTRDGGFGNSFSFAISNQMYSRDNANAIKDARDGLEIQALGKGAWALRFPIVNVAVFETRNGLVVIDSGYASAGPALRAALSELSDMRVHTIIITHHHIDHALGAWALLQDNPKAQVIATEEFVRQQQLDLNLSNYVSRLNHQAPETWPRSWSDVVRPTRTFSKELKLRVGGETFIITAASGETADQLYVHVPARDTIVVADYYQRFIPNAGNGRRRVRHIGEWSEALAAMANLKASTMIPMHGPVLTNPSEIEDRLRAHSAILESIDNQVKSALNEGVPEHQVARRVRLPERFSGRDDVRELYVSVQDVAKMALHQYTGWWNDIPSEWNAPAVDRRASELVKLAGGVAEVVKRANELRDSDAEMACYLIDQAFFAQPRHPEVLKSAYSIYLTRLFAAKPPIQEALVYIDHLVSLRFAMKELGVEPPKLSLEQ